MFQFLLLLFPLSTWFYSRFFFREKNSIVSIILVYSVSDVTFVFFGLRAVIGSGLFSSTVLKLLIQKALFIIFTSQVKLLIFIQ